MTEEAPAATEPAAAAYVLSRSYLALSRYLFRIPASLQLSLRLHRHLQRRLSRRRRFVAALFPQSFSVVNDTPQKSRRLSTRVTELFKSKPKAAPAAETPKIEEEPAAPAAATA